MSRFVLVHGAWHGSWFWRGVVEDLTARGHDVLAVDLPGRGGTPARRGLFGGWRTTITDSVETVLGALGPDREPVVLVGHSFGGLTITQVGEVAPDRIKSLVYMAALLPRNGDRATGLNRLMPENPVNKICKLKPWSGTLTLPLDKCDPVFYTDCGPTDIADAHRRISRELVGPSFSRIRTTAARWGSLDKLYVHCTKDQAIPPATQLAMCERTGVTRISTLETGHSPNYSMRKELVELLAAEG